jgi:hypothetical protein
MPEGETPPAPAAEVAPPDDEPVDQEDSPDGG